MMLLIVLVQSIGFSTGFVFVEAAGAIGLDTKVSNNEVLKGIKMSAQRARWLEEISEYVNAEGLRGREVLLYGDIPAAAFYLQMPPAFNSWPDLDSYSFQAMEEDMEELEQEVSNGKTLPVMIFSTKCEEGPKLQLLRDFAEKYRYHQTFENEKFMVLLPWE